MLRTRYNYEDSTLECGIDEAGRGSFWGPMMAAAVIWEHEDNWTDAHREIAPRLKDSKKITPKRRAVLDQKIRDLSIAWGVGIVTAKELDDNGVSWANQNAFVRAVEGLQFRDGSDRPEHIRFLVDGVLPMPPVEIYRDSEYLTITDGDASYMSIAAASIVAKEAHDRWIADYCEAYPELVEKYNIAACKGYGTAKHREGISMHGMHELHRRRYIHGAARRGERGLPVRLVDAECLVKLKTASDKFST
jgi:ribonuclease HII